MRATILYLAYRWTEFEMLLTPLRFLYLVMFSLLALSYVLPFSNSYRNESCSKACSAHFANAVTFFLFSPSERTKWRSKKGPQILESRDLGDLEL